MPLELKEIDPEVDFPALARCMFESYEDPPQKFFHVFFPTHGNSNEAREAAIDEAATRLKMWHTHDPSSYWQKMVDTETGKIAGGSLWNIHKDSPFANTNPSQVSWFPEGGSRSYVEKALERHSAPRARVAQKPHLYQYHNALQRFSFCIFRPWLMNKPDLFIIFTHPEYRRKGVGQQFMDWGFDKAEELGFETSTWTRRRMIVSCTRPTGSVTPRRTSTTHRWMTLMRPGIRLRRRLGSLPSGSCGNLLARLRRPRRLLRPASEVDTCMQTWSVG